MPAPVFFLQGIEQAGAVIINVGAFIMQRSLAHASWILLAALCQAPAADLPPLPEVELGGLDERHRKQAAAALKRAAAEPNDADTVGSLAMLLHALGRSAEAAACYERARAIEPGSFRWSYYLGVTLDDLQRREKAIEALSRARESSGDYAPYFVRLGELLREEGRVEEAEAALRKALELQPLLPSAHLGMGKLLAGTSHFEDAVGSYERAVELAPNYGAAHYALGLAYRRTDRPEEAKHALERYQRLRPLAQPTFDPLLDAVAALRGDGASAAADPSVSFTLEQRRAFAEELERAIAGNPDLISAHANLVALYWQLGDAAGAERHYRRALEIDPGYADAHYNWGGVELARGNPDAALASFEKALEANPNHTNALVQSGLLVERSGRGDEAEERYLAALEAHPAHRQANYLLARRLVGRGEYAEAARRLEETVRIEDEATPSYLRALASTYLRAGDAAAARQRLEDAERQARSLGRQDLAAQISTDLEKLGQ